MSSRAQEGRPQDRQLEAAACGFLGASGMLCARPGHHVPGTLMPAGPPLPPSAQKGAWRLSEPPISRDCLLARWASWVECSVIPEHLARKGTVLIRRLEHQTKKHPEPTSESSGL